MRQVHFNHDGGAVWDGDFSVHWCKWFDGNKTGKHQVSIFGKQFKGAIQNMAVVDDFGNLVGVSFL